MIGIGIANSLGVNLSGLNPAARSFVTAAGISDPNKVQAINNLVSGLQASGIWSKMKAVYPFVTDNRNLLGYTEDFGNAYWAINNSSITANSITAPNGTLTADSLVDNSTNGVHSVARQLTLTNATYSYSVHCKKGNRDWSWIALYDGSTTTFGYFNLTNGTLGTVDSGATATITDSGNGWYRCTLSRPMTTSVDNYINVGSAPTNGGAIYIGNATVATYIWGAQLELGSTATAYQPILTTQQAYIANQFKYNLKDPRDTGEAFRLVFNGGWSMSDQGATPNGVNAYADTKLNDSLLTPNSSHMSYYSRTNIITNTYDMGIYNGTKGIWFALANASGSVFTGGIFQAGTSGEVSVSNTNSTGYYIGGKNGSTTVKFYKNGASVASATKTDTTATNTTIYLASLNQNGTPSFGFSTKQVAFATIGDGLTDDDATNLYYYTQVFQTSLGRQIGSPAYGLPTTYDANAKLYLSAIGSTTNNTFNDAINTFITGLKADGIYSKMKAVYPFATDNSNLLSYTEDFSNAYWQKQNCNITTDVISAPNGTMTADKMSDSTTANTFRQNRALPTISTPTATTYTFSVYLKAGERNWAYLNIEGGTIGIGTNFNLSTGTIGTFTIGTTATMTSVGNGWYRCTVSGNIGTGNIYPVIYTLNGDGIFNYVGVVGSGIYIWGAQLELGSTATPYQPQLGSAQAYFTNQFKYNMVNPQDDDAAFRLVFNGGWTMSPQGATPNGTNGYADTKLVADNNLTYGNVSLSFYSRTNSAGNFTDIGSYGNALNDFKSYGLQCRQTSNIGNSAIYDGKNTLDWATLSVTNSQGYFIANRQSTTNNKMIKNNTAGTVNSINIPYGLLSNPNSIYIGAANNFTAIQYSNRQCAFSSIGNGLTDTEAANLYTRVQTLQTTLNRQV